MGDFHGMINITIIVTLLKHKPDLSKEAARDRHRKEQQVTRMLLLVTFGFVILITPLYIMFVLPDFGDYPNEPAKFAAFNLYYHIAHKAFYTNSAVNVVFYALL